MYATLAQKLDLLLRSVMQPNGRRFTYDDLHRKTGVRASTISRIRKGENEDPQFRTIIGLAKAFGVRVSYFSTEMTLEEAEEYLTNPKSTEFLEDLRHRQLQEENEAHHKLVSHISLRANHLNEEGLVAMASMLDYVLKQQGLEIDKFDKEAST